MDSFDGTVEAVAGSSQGSQADQGQGNNAGGTEVGAGAISANTGAPDSPGFMQGGHASAQDVANALALNVGVGTLATTGNPLAALAATLAVMSAPAVVQLASQPYSVLTAPQAFALANPEITAGAMPVFAGTQ